LSTYALMRCHATFRIPILMLSTYRGGLGDQEWYAAHTAPCCRICWRVCASPARSCPAQTSSHDICRCPAYDELVTAPVSIVMDVRLTTRE